jgi:hypothetical protein
MLSQTTLLLRKEPIETRGKGLHLKDLNESATACMQGFTRPWILGGASMQSRILPSGNKVQRAEAAGWCR